MTDYAELRARFTAERPSSIREKVAAWAFDEADSAEEVIRRLQSIDCAACHSPAPILYQDMAEEIAEHWPEIDEALDKCREITGEAWAPHEGQGVLDYLWFAYEWVSHQLAGEIRRALDAGPEHPAWMPEPVRPGTDRLPSPGEIANDNEPYTPGHGPDRGHRR